MKGSLFFSIFLAVYIGTAVNNIRAQDPQFTQFYANQLYLSPAFAGLTKAYRGFVHYRNQWTGLSVPFQTYAFTFDKRLNKINSGAGFMVYDQVSGGRGYHSLKIAGQFAHEIKLTRKLFIRMGGELGYIHQSIDFSNFTFGDQLNQNGSKANDQSLEKFDNRVQDNLGDISFGFLLFNEKYWLGTSVHHMNKPDLTFFQDQVNKHGTLPRKYALYGGFKTYFNKPFEEPEEDDLHMTPVFLFKLQGGHYQMDLGTYINKSPVQLGLWYRGLPFLSKGGHVQQDALAILAGIEISDQWQLGYSYDLPLSKMIQYTGTHEITLAFTFQQKDKYKLLDINVIPEI